eukprot:4388231-Pleurochrysis_carterae.AAC.2
MAAPKAATFRRMDNNAQVEIWRGWHDARSSSRERVTRGATPGASEWRSVRNVGRWLARSVSFAAVALACTRCASERCSREARRSAVLFSAAASACERCASASARG